MPKDRLPEWATTYDTVAQGRVIEDLTRRIQILERPRSVGAMGEVGYFIATSTIPNIGSSGARVVWTDSFTFGQRRVFKITGTWAGVSSSVTGDTLGMWISVAGVVLNNVWLHTNNASHSAEQGGTIVAVYINDTDNDITASAALSGFRSSGSGLMAVYASTQMPTQLLIEDMGGTIDTSSAVVVRG